jgi:hypothetical protein
MGSWLASLKPYITDVSTASHLLSTTYELTKQEEPCTTNLLDVSMHTLCLDEGGEASTRQLIVGLADAVRRARIAFKTTSRAYGRGPRALGP